MTSLIQAPSNTGNNTNASTPVSTSIGSPNTSTSTNGPVVPYDYFECSMSNLVNLVSSMLQKLIDINDKIELNIEKLTRFHSRSPPGISAKDYLVRIVRYCSVEKSILLTMVYFIDLLSTCYPSFSITSLTVHRFMITAITVGSKGLCDSFCTNSHYARVGGIPAMELNLLEVEFLTRVDYRIVPTVEKLSQYYTSMVTHSHFEFGETPVRSSMSVRSPPITADTNNQYPMTPEQTTPSSYGPQANQEDQQVKNQLYQQQQLQQQLHQAEQLQEEQLRQQQLQEQLAQQQLQQEQLRQQQLQEEHIRQQQQLEQEHLRQQQLQSQQAQPQAQHEEPTSAERKSKRSSFSFKKNISKLIKSGVKRPSENNPPGPEAVQEENPQNATTTNIKTPTTPKRPKPLI